MHVIGLDIGGANLKIAHQDGPCLTAAFPLWRQPNELAAKLSELLSGFPEPDLLAVTITGELADCFTTKAEGVDRILTSVEKVADGVPIAVWQTGGEFISPELAREIPLLVSAANWHALCTWLGRMIPAGAALLLDIGSTTTDIIPLLDGRPVPTGFTDRERLIAGELVYSGVKRTPLCALAHSVPVGTDSIPLAAEIFATTLDLYLFLDVIPEEPENRQTANDQPATQAAATTRLARMLCCDENEVSPEELNGMATFLADVQRNRILGAIKKVLVGLQEQTPEPVSHVLISGSGGFLARHIAEDILPEAAQIVLDEMFDPATATAACALAVARLAVEQYAFFKK